MHDTKRRRYGFLPSYRKSLSLDNCVAILTILLFMGLVFHTLAPSVSKPTPEVPPEGTEWRTKPACLEDDVICLIHEYSAKYGIETDIALRVARAENELFDEEAINYNPNGTTDGGIYQINSIHNVPDECRLDARCNIEWAMKTMSTAGTTPWYSSKHRWYEH